MPHSLKATALFTVLLASWAFAMPATAQDSDSGTYARSASLTATAKFAIQVNVDAFRKTPLGGEIFAALRQHAVQEIVKESQNQEAPEKIQEALGFDPFDEIKGFTLVGSDFEHPEESLKLILRMGKTTGNLEGLLLSLPDYDASSHGDYLIHSAAPDGRQIFGAIHTDATGVKTVALAMSREDVIQLLDAIQGDSVSQRLRLPGAEESLLSVRLDELPMEKIDKGTPSNIAKLLQHVAVVINDQRGDFDCKMVLTAKQDKQAEQLQQMAQGLVAMVALAEPEPGEAENMQQLQELLQDLKVTREGSEVALDLKVPVETVRQLLEDETELSL